MVNVYKEKYEANREEERMKKKGKAQYFTKVKIEQ